MRLLEPRSLPRELWNEDEGVVFVPPCLAFAYEGVIDAAGLRAIAGIRDPKNPPVGGATQELADLHFAQAFDSSASRIQFALMDPQNVLGETSDTLVRCLSASELVLVDAPCGAGAASLSLLCSLATLRHKGVLPRSPLYIKLIGGEISDAARSYAECVTRRVLEELESQGIFVERTWMPWDVLSKVSTADLIRAAVTASKNVHPCCVVVANFSDFLQRERKRVAAEPCIDDLMCILSRGGGAAFWIEPATNHAVHAGGLLPWVTSKLMSGWKKLFKTTATQDSSMTHLVASARYQRVLFPAERPRINVAVVRCEFRGRE